jgi:DNA-binding GntR family transcriptional regulator
MQVADDLRSQITSGRFAVGQEIPSTAKLSEQHGVSVGVIRTAVRLLQDEGILIGQSGKGVYVRATPEAAAEEAAQLKSVDQQVTELRAEVERLASQQPSDVIERIDELQAEVGKLQADLRHLYDRLGQPYPHSQSDAKPKQRRTSGT